MADVDRRGVSTAVGYVLNLAVALLLVTGLLVAASGLITDQRDRAVRTELNVLEERFAADIATADRLTRVAEGGGSRVAVTSDFPRRVAGRSYRISVTDYGSTVEIRLVEPRSDVSVIRRIPIETDVENTTRAGGPIRVGTDGNGTLVVTDD